MTVLVHLKVYEPLNHSIDQTKIMGINYFWVKTYTQNNLPLILSPGFG